MINPGQLVMLVSPKGKRYFRISNPEETINTNDGQLQMQKVMERGFGSRIDTHLGRTYTVLKPTLYDLIKSVKRRTQIIYPKDIGYIIVKLGIGPGSRVIESGSGSGAMTTALAWFVGNEGRVYSYERREEFATLCRSNLEKNGLAARVENIARDISLGFDQNNVDALFLDVRTPWDYLEHIPGTLLAGGPIGFLLPTANQVSTLLDALERGPFTSVEVLEILVRRYKPVPERLRPDDRMVAHTGYLVFARLAVDGPMASYPEEDDCLGDECDPC
ncbi:tRNA (adenine-N1)-methyltransferase [Desulfonatronovibrio hydrogenovorans]|uniref:tRNA (adenine-N1)-methyltransferase n=1 Tax=Desulfonatronovibrio hydrogenovorans TaxID=53245 RepID=UPI0009FC26A0|nr:tRNA (adenine-N1)-methyltransferase [Desulfonatronovibrio hydrogenovorans]